MSKYYSRIFVIGSMLLFGAQVSAQVKIGDSPEVIAPASVLELESTDKGFLPPRINLSGKNTWSLSGAEVEGMVVFNTNATADGIDKGLTTWFDSEWHSLNVSFECDTFLTPLFNNDTLFLINSCSTDTTVVPIVGTLDDTRCYLQELPLNEPTSAANTTTGKGYVKRRVHLVNELSNLGNSGSSDPGFRPEAISAFPIGVNDNGELVEANVTTMDANGTSAYGAWVEWDGYLYIPIRYPDATTGKNVTKTELVEISTSTAYTDCDYLYIAEAGGVYSQQEEDLKLKINCPDAGAQPSYQFDQSQAGRWVRFKTIHSDYGGAAQVSWRIRLTFEDNSTSDYTVRNFIHNMSDQGLSVHAATEKRKLIHDIDTDIWTHNGSVVTVNTGLGNLERVNCEDIQISFSTYSSGSTFTIQSVFGGSGAGYEYSIDGCKTFQGSANFDLSSYEVIELLPCVKDGDGMSSALNSGDTYVGPRSSWSSDLTGGATNDIAYDGGAGDSGWFINYSTVENTDNFTDPNSDSRWSTEICTEYESTQVGMFGDFKRSELSDLGGAGSISATYDPVFLTGTGGAWQNTSLTPITVGQKFSWKQPVGNIMVGVANSTTPGNYNAVTIDALGYVSSASNFRLYHSNGTNSSTNHAQVGISPLDIFTIQYTNATTIDFLRNGTIIASETVTAGTKYIALATNGTRTIESSSLVTVPAYLFTQLPSGDYIDPIGNVHTRDMIRRLGGTCTVSSPGSAEDDPAVSFSGGFMYFHNGGTEIGGVVVNTELISSSVSGQKYTLAFDNYMRALGVAGDLIDVRFEVVNSMGTILNSYTFNSNGSGTETIAANATLNATNRYFSFVGDGGAIRLVISDLSRRASTVLDSHGHYIRIDNVKLMIGEYNDASHFFKSQNTYLQARGVSGEGIVTTDPHDVSQFDVVHPVLDIRDYGSPDDDEESFIAEYSFDGTTWISFASNEGQTDQNNDTQFQDYVHRSGIDVSAASTIQYRIRVLGIGQAADGYNIYEIRDTGYKL